MRSVIRSLPEVVRSFLGSRQLSDEEVNAVHEIGRVGYFVNLASGFAKMYEDHSINLDEIHRSYSDATYKLNAMWREVEEKGMFHGGLAELLSIRDTLREVNDRNSAEEFVHVCEIRLRSEQGIGAEE